MLHELSNLFTRDLHQLAREMSLYEQEELLWVTTGEISNSAGNLCLHLIGNIRHFIGATIGNTGYVRNRDKEFSDKHIPVSTLLEGIELTRKETERVLNSMDSKLLGSDYPIKVFGKTMTYSYFLMHLQGHLNYHLGQINYHRRLLGTRRDAK